MSKVTAALPLKRGRPAWQSALMWFGGGMALTWLVAFFLDRERGAARRHMAVDRSLATARDVGQWSGKKARHMGNKARGAMAEMQNRDAAREAL